MLRRLSTLFGSSSTAITAVAAGGALLVAAAVGLTIWRGTDPEPFSLSEVEPESGIETTTEPEREVAAASEPPSAPELEPPSFDLVRVDPTGNAVIAGRVDGGAEVALLLDGAMIEVARADQGGSFVALLSLDPSDAPRILSLETRLATGQTLPSEETVIIAPFAGAPPAQAHALPEDPGPDETEAEDVAAQTAADDPATTFETPGTDMTSDAAPVSTDPDSRQPDPAPTQTAALQTPEETESDAVPVAPESGSRAAEPSVQTAMESAPDAAQDMRPADPPVATTGATVPMPATGADPAIAAGSVSPAAPTVLMTTDEGVRVMQSPSAEPMAQTEVRLDAISYDEEGGVRLSGRGVGDAPLRVMLDGREVETGAVGAGGDWSLALLDVDPGTYTLRVEQMDEDGRVMAGLETPFLREDPDRIAANPMLVASGASVITVQPGFTLWGIADANFGDGFLYVQIFERNRSSIRDPDLIFPGQIFSLPDLPRSAPAE